MTSICVFGSVARKDQDDLSDKDVLILFDGSKYCKQLMQQWSGSGWSVASYTERRLWKMADAGSLFVQHLKQEGIVLEDTNNVLSNLLAHYEPKSNYTEQLMKSVSAIKLLEHVPPTHELGYWSADLLHVLIRNIGILKLANEGIYEFSFSGIAKQLIRLGIIQMDDLEIFDGLRSAKSAYRHGLLPFNPIDENVEGGLRVIEKLCSVSLERSHTLDAVLPRQYEPNFNLRAMEKLLLSYNGLPKGGYPFVSVSEMKIWKIIMDPRAYSWDIKANQSKLERLLKSSINANPSSGKQLLTSQIENFTQIRRPH